MISYRDDTGTKITINISNLNIEQLGNYMTHIEDTLCIPVNTEHMFKQDRSIMTIGVYITIGSYWYNRCDRLSSNMNKRKCRGCGKHEGDIVNGTKIRFSISEGYQRHKCGRCRRFKVSTKYPKWKGDEELDKLKVKAKIAERKAYLRLSVVERIRLYFKGER